ncbi:hypothetical protein DIQ79_22825 [Mycolicibacterium smegmatis]|uniref:Uncharacterized protein n=1 Tax=Mycolicibacterium smegmatis (strain ATCC 700084 / mc(2)155) TaxID=246196 RepID=A0QVF4_MYCS2|nr:hypothetical protein MSMEG_2555 [Mycolicibacterium smegmatis MC2 155]TBM44241.1 hypothetical protein DIQ86_17105 [Mycolicibacterium smegmatis]TBH32163.1 hypothetical protein EYS45_24575 [Mycolicibacterium smegmatis MC2 155]TBM48867.1 hypothetical protein DIQ85_23080 [Mycolicibacterium smegmatis]TBM57715.1 hypothetical protein DIQ83_24845 [Mycolicibacterium smegmatis]
MRQHLRNPRPGSRSKPAINGWNQMSGSSATRRATLDAGSCRSRTSVVSISEPRRAWVATASSSPWASPMISDRVTCSPIVRGWTKPISNSPARSSNERAAIMRHTAVIVRVTTGKRWNTPQCACAVTGLSPLALMSS